MSLALGELVGRVVIESAAAESKITSLMRLFREFGTKAEAATAGTATLDRELMGVATAATKAAEGLDRTSVAARTTAAAEDKAAAAAAAQARAVARLSGVMESLVGLTAREQQAQLRLIAAQERLNALQVSGTATTRQLASAQSSLIGAQQGVLAAQKRAEAASGASAERMLATGKKMSHAITLPVLAAAAVSIKTSMDFDKATNVYVTAAGESARNLGIVRDGIKRTVVETGESISQLTAAQYILEKANIRGAGSQVLLNAATKGAIEENANLADVVQGATSVMASYHLGTDKSVQVINALKTAAGESKTTMEDFVKSLATVIPVASAAGISLAQVLGAEATLTQHGTSPAEATQELANTIRNLQAPSNVAVSAMNQLGISSVDVSKNLGRRGLTGTLEFIESKLPKTGLVYLTTMKQMESGTADLNAMQAKMPPQLATLSKGFLDGTVSAKTYRKDIRDLGAEGYAQGSQFLSLAAKVSGYNDSIRNGTPAQKTMAAELKALFGGAVGLNTALQLGGQNLDGFKTRTDAVGKSLHDNAKEVEGWDSTSKLASTHAAQFKESLHVLAINAGATLLPMLRTLADDGSKAVGWIDGLSHTDKELLGWSIASVALLGPVLSIFGRFGRLLTLGSRLVTWRSEMLGVSSAAQRSASQVAEAEAAQTRAIVTETDLQIAAIERMRAVAGAPVPMGAPIVRGGAAGAAGRGGIMASGRGAGGALVGTALLIGGPMIGGAVGGKKGSERNVLGTVGADAATGAGLGLMIGGAPGAFLGGLIGGGYGLSTSLPALQSHLALNTIAALNKRMAATADPGGAGGSRAIAGHGSIGVPDMVYGSAKLDALSMDHSAAGMRKFEVAERDAALAASVLGKSLADLRTNNISVRKSASEFGSALHDIAGRAKESKAGLDGASSASRVNRAYMIEALTAAEQHAAALQKSGKSAEFVRDALLKDVGALEKTATKAGFNKREFEGMLKTMGLTPKQITTVMSTKTELATQKIHELQARIDRIRQNKEPHLRANDTEARGVIAALQAQIDNLRDKSVTVTATMRGNLASTYASQVPRFSAPINRRALASGGDVVGSGPRGVDSVPVLGAPGEWMATVTGADLLRRVFGSSGMKAINRGHLPVAAPVMSGGQGSPTLHTGNIAEALHGMRIVIDAGSVGTLTGFVDSRVDGTLGRAARTPVARQARVDAFGRT